MAACFGGGVPQVAGNFLFLLVSNDSDVEGTGDVFARCLKTLLKLHFRYCQQVLSQQQTRLEQYRAYSGEKMETGFVSNYLGYV